jgi:SAM-dependent methyltransferase
MKRSHLIRTIQHLADTKPSFMLSEIARSPGTPATPEGLYREILPHLPALGLQARKIGNDYEVEKIPAGHPYRLSPAEEQRLTAFLAGRTFPTALERAVEAYIGKKTGKNWTDQVTLERLRRAIVAQKADYWKEPGRRRLSYTKGYAVLGYLAYHFPVYFMQTEYLLAMLAGDGLLKPSMTILDVGSGPGVVPLAIAAFWSRLDNARAAVWSVERSEEQVEAFMFLRDAVVPRGEHVSVKPPVRADIHEVLPHAIPEKVDLIVFSNVLNELPDSTMDTRAGIVERMADRLAPDGSILIIEPADEENSTCMRTLTAELYQRGLFVHAPCTFIRGTTCTAPRCWSFATAPAIRPTRLMEALASCGESYRYVNTDIKYSYAILRKDGVRMTGYRVAPGAKFIRFSKLHLAVGKRANVAAVKMSSELGDAKNHLFKVCDGTAKTPVYAVLPAFHMTPENEALRTAPYGTVLEMKGVLVRYNREHDAYNLLVSRNTEIQIPEAGNR